MKKELKKPPTTQSGRLRPTPSSTTPNRLESAMLPSTPCTRRSGPPQTLSARLPTTPPTPAKECIVPSVVALFAVRARIIGANTVVASVATRLKPKNTSCNPRRLGRAKM